MKKADQRKPAWLSAKRGKPSRATGISLYILHSHPQPPNSSPDKPQHGKTSTPTPNSITVHPVLFSPSPAVISLPVLFPVEISIPSVRTHRLVYRKIKTGDSHDDRQRFLEIVIENSRMRPAARTAGPPGGKLISTPPTHTATGVGALESHNRDKKENNLGIHRCSLFCLVILQRWPRFWAIKE